MLGRVGELSIMEMGHSQLVQLLKVMMEELDLRSIEVGFKS